MTLQDEINMELCEKAVKLTLAGVVLALGGYKVWNERQMTRMYERQAVALERIAGGRGDFASSAQNTWPVNCGRQN